MTNTSEMSIAGILLAAGQGRRMGKPKSLMFADDGSSWLLNSRDRMLEAGCTDVLVVLGAEAEKAATLVADGWHMTVDSWAEGIGESLRVGLSVLSSRPFDAVLVHLVDLPDVGSDAMRRVLSRAYDSTLARATYNGVPGHPVLIGRKHWPDLINVLSGDTGAKPYLDAHGTRHVECGDLATGKDVDTKSELKSRLTGH